MSKQRRSKGPRPAWEPKPAPAHGPVLATASPLDTALADVTQADVALAETAATDVAWPTAARTDVALRDITAPAPVRAEGSGPSQPSPQAQDRPVRGFEPASDPEPRDDVEPVAATAESPLRSDDGFPAQETEAVTASESPFDAAEAPDAAEASPSAEPEDATRVDAADIEAPAVAAASEDADAVHPEPTQAEPTQAEPSDSEPSSSEQSHAASGTVPDAAGLIAATAPIATAPIATAPSMPVRSASAVYWMPFAPEQVDLTSIGATIAGYMRGESEAAAVYMRALGGARSPADMIRLQVGEFQRAADASLTCWSLVAHKASRAFAHR